LNIGCALAAAFEPGGQKIPTGKLSHRGRVNKVLGLTQNEAFLVNAFTRRQIWRRQDKDGNVTLLLPRLLQGITKDCQHRECSKPWGSAGLGLMK
jgi:hypothetical protein